VFEKIKQREKSKNTRDCIYISTTQISSAREKNSNDNNNNRTNERKICSSRKESPRYSSSLPSSSFSSRERKPQTLTWTMMKISTPSPRCVKPIWKNKSKSQKLRCLTSKRAKSWNRPQLGRRMIREMPRECTFAGEMENLQLCGFTKPENCKNEQPYPRDETNTEPLEDPFECGIDDETNPDTGFVCEKVSFKVEEDGDLAYEGDISVPNEKEGEGDAAASTNNRKLLQLRRRGVGLRSRSLRSNGARGRIG